MWWFCMETKGKPSQLPFFLLFPHPSLPLKQGKVETKQNKKERKRKENKRYKNIKEVIMKEKG